MKALVETDGGRYEILEMGLPKCGEDFCESCGDCLYCHGGDTCYCSAYGEDGGFHSIWVIYKDDERNPLTNDNKKH